MDGTDLAKEVSTKRPYVWEVGERSHEPVALVGVKDEPARFHVVAYDFGIKKNILRKLRGEGCKVTVVPAQTKAEDVLALKPDGVFLSNGPGRSRAVHVCGRFHSSFDGPAADLWNLPGASTHPASRWAEKLSS